jgi:hypothetical protein
MLETPLKMRGSLAHTLIDPFEIENVFGEKDLPTTATTTIRGAEGISGRFSSAKRDGKAGDIEGVETLKR